MKNLPDVTLVMITSLDRDTSVKVLRHCKKRISFGAVKLLTDMKFSKPPKGIEVVPIDKITSLPQYSHFVVNKLVDHVETSHCLLVQTDGFIINPGEWDDEFLKYDYVAGPWAPFANMVTGPGLKGWITGCGGFSLRSHKFLKAVSSFGYSLDFFNDPKHEVIGSEDILCGRVHRMSLQAHGIKFAPKELGFRFALESGSTEEKTWGKADQGQFGFHGSMPHMAEGLKGHSKDLYEEDYENRAIRRGGILVYDKHK